MKGTATCKICGRDFPLIAAEHFIVQDPRKIGVLANLANTDKATMYDAFDCPYCGCQNIMQERKPLWFPDTSDCNCDDSDEEFEEKSDEGLEEKHENIETVDDMRTFLQNFCEPRHCDGCPLDKRGFLCGRGYTFKSTRPGEFGYLPDKEIKRHYEVVKEVK